MNKILIVQLGIAPTYKKRILNSIKNEPGYDLYDVLLLTDDIDYFKELQEKENIYIVDINEIRKNYPWSLEYERLPKEKHDEALYAKEILENNFKFPTFLQRFCFEWEKVYDYDGFLWMDADITPIKNEIYHNMMINYFCNKEFGNNPWGFELDSAKNKIICCPGGSSYDELHHGHLLDIAKKINEKYKITTKEIKHNFLVTDGNFRTFNFPNKSYYKPFFNLINNILKDTYANEDESYFILNTHSAWNGHSEYILSIVLNLMDGMCVPMNSCDTGIVSSGANGSFWVRCFPEDRFWNWGWETDINEGKMGFVKRNYEKLKEFYTNRGEVWPYDDKEFL